MVKSILTYLSNFRRYCACALRKYTKMRLYLHNFLLRTFAVNVPSSKYYILLPNIYLIKIHEKTVIK